MCLRELNQRGEPMQGVGLKTCDAETLQVLLELRGHHIIMKYGEEFEFRSRQSMKQAFKQTSDRGNAGNGFQTPDAEIRRDFRANINDDAAINHGPYIYVGMPPKSRLTFLWVTIHPTVTNMKREFFALLALASFTSRAWCASIEVV